MKDLNKLSLQSNELFGSIPSLIFQLSKLTSIDFSENALSSTIPNDIFHLNQLSSLNLGYNHFTGLLPPILSKLQHLNISQNGFHGPIISSPRTQFRYPDDIDVIDISFNSFSGLDIFSGDGIQAFSNLRQLHFDGNNLNTDLPSSLDSLSSLSVLSGSRCRLTGRIPQEAIGRLSNLKVLSLSENELTGNIPSTIGNLQKLQVLELYDNNLDGRIPDSLLQLPSLSKYFKI